MLNQSINAEEAVVLDFGKALENSIKVAYSFIVYGSYGRGTFTANSDIDAMLIFNLKDVEEILSEDVIRSLPFDWPMTVEGRPFFDREDLDDLRKGKLDFLRLEGRSRGIEVELQLMPVQSIVKAVDENGGDLVAGKRSIDGLNETIDRGKKSREQNYRNEFFLFARKPRLATMRGRVDSVECGHKKVKGVLTRSLTHNKLFAPKIVTDHLELEQYLDEVVLFEAIKSVLEARDLFIKNEKNEIIGIKPDGLDYKNYFEFLASVRMDKIDPLNFAEIEEAEFAERFYIQIKKIIGGANEKDV